MHLCAPPPPPPPPGCVCLKWGFTLIVSRAFLYAAEESIKDTESYVNIDLDSSQNRFVPACLHACE